MLSSRLSEIVHMSIFASWVERVCLYDIFCNRIHMIENRLASSWACLFKSENAGKVQSFLENINIEKTVFGTPKPFAIPGNLISFLSPRTSSQKIVLAYRPVAKQVLLFFCKATIAKQKGPFIISTFLSSVQSLDLKQASKYIGLYTSLGAGFQSTRRHACYTLL